MGVQGCVHVFVHVSICVYVFLCACACVWDTITNMTVRTYLPSWFLERSRVLSCEHFHLLVAGSVTMWFPHNLNETKACGEEEWEEGWDTINHIFTSFQGMHRQLGNRVINQFSWKVKVTPQWGVTFKWNVFESKQIRWPQSISTYFQLQSRLFIKCY